MRHATPLALDRLEPLLQELRAIEGLTERVRGNFQRRSKALLHFHEDPEGLFADLKQDGDWVRYRVSTARERKRFVARVRAKSRGTRGEG